MSFRVSPILWYYVPPVAWAAAIFVASHIPSEEFPFQIEISDKIIHAAVFFVFTALVHRALLFQQASDWLRTNSLAASIVIGIVYGALDEFHQSFVPGRNMSGLDLLADAIGSLAYGLVWRLRGRRKGV
jgi:VanZ family protein